MQTRGQKKLGGERQDGSVGMPMVSCLEGEGAIQWQDMNTFKKNQENMNTFNESELECPFFFLCVCVYSFDFCRLKFKAVQAGAPNIV